MHVTTGRSSAVIASLDSDAILERARTGTRLMTIRGAVMRGISIGANLLLLALVSPTELGLLAVARGTFTLLQYIAELGIGKAMVRRAHEPTRAEYAALAGLQLLVGVLVVTLGAFWSAPILGFGSIDQRWHWAMLGTVATMTSLAFGTGARTRLERSLSYERLAVVDVINVLILNVGLVVFALLHQFSLGVFVLLGVATVSANFLLYVWAPGPRPSLDLRPLVGIARESSGFLAGSTFQILREQGTPVLIAALFGLPVAGLYSFGERVAQVLNVTFEGFRNAGVPAAARLAGDLRSLRTLSTRCLVGSASLAAPMAVISICALPLVAHLVPRWSDAISLAQWYVVAYAIYGVVSASMQPAAIATRGATAAIAEQGAALLGGWISFIVLRAVGSPYLAIAVAIMYLAPIRALWSVTSEEIRPERSDEVVRIAIATACSIALYLVLRLLAAPLIVTAALPPVLVLAAVRQFRHRLRQLLRFGVARRANT
ncbi:MAG: oligosaccharide flippase family protein [Gemmatimonadota bacterium]